MTDAHDARILGLRYEWVAAAVFLVIAVPVMLLGQGERSAYVQTFSNYPGGQASFGEFGGNYIRGDTPFMAENDLYITQILMFNGSPNSISMHFVAARPMYAFLSSLLAPVFGVMGGQMFLNFLAWAAAAAIAWRFARSVFDDRLAALIATVLVAGGLGFAIHSNDYSPHLLPFTIYYLGLLVVYESGVWKETRPLSTHLLVGLFLAVACLTYTMELVFAIGYVLVSLRRNKWWHIAVAAGLAFSSRWVYEFGLNVAHMFVIRGFDWLAIDATESNYLGLSLAVWVSQLGDPPALFSSLWRGLVQFSLFEVPVIVILGLLSWLAQIRGPALWGFFLVFAILPVAGGMAFLHHSTTRGYMVYGISLLLYAPLAALLARGLRSARSARVGAAAALLLVVAAQLAWSTAFLWGYIVPAKMFFGFGDLGWIPQYFWHLSPAPAFSLTGLEPTPLFFGGSASLPEAGMFVVRHLEQPVYYSPAVALLTRGVILAYLMAIAWMAIDSTRTRMRTLAAIAVGLGIVPSILPRILPPAKPPVVSTFYTTHMPPESKLAYRVDVSPAFIEQLRSHEAASAKVQFATPGIHAPFDVSVTNGAGREFVSSSTGGMLLDATVPVSEVVASLAASPTLVLNLTTRDKDHGSPIGTSLFGWQRNGLPHREMMNALTGQKWDSPMLPQLELRLVDRGGRAILIGY